jgi:hypothetical protein
MSKKAKQAYFCWVLKKKSGAPRFHPSMVFPRRPLQFTTRDAARQIKSFDETPVRVRVTVEEV